ncbi:hypothetical protein JQX13_21965 [Archangium violaceum]|uniref:hypothetical protein n=1 Tax=Archangium violaceum TaxID=83451 RepID=UPI00193BB67C|nr:hypothetical protein [Archangium violaceum]QRK12453.1 hypothetical protein JQX13_21965 [Archangium violaceum]
MRIPSWMAAWVCIGTLGLGAQVRAEDEPSSLVLSVELGLTCDEDDDDLKRDGDDDDDDDDDEGEPCNLGAPERRHIVDNVFEHTYRVRVGRGAYDFITLHRVVRETVLGTPMPSPKSVFFVHGDLLGFRGAFLGSAGSVAVPRRQSIAVFLARQGVDVWGIDLRWVHVPASTTNFSFMKNWNLGMHARDVGTGLKLARSTRLFTGSGGGQMVLLGWSRGATVSYAYLNGETQLPAVRRQVSGFIPVDMAYTFAPEDRTERQMACAFHAVLAQLQAAGEYEAGGVGLLVQSLGRLAMTQPDAPSPYMSGFTNRQAALTFGGATFRLQEPVIIPDYHWTGAMFSEVAPTGLVWTSERLFVDSMVQALPYQSLGEQVDTLAMWCGKPDVPYDDHLRKVKVPVLYVGAAGGMGTYGLHSLSLLGSKDVTPYVVQRFEDEAARAVEYGHADLFLADDAEALVWTPILDWVLRH